jgi:hypothetical protein
MAVPLSVVGVVLIVGWGVWYWLLRGHQQSTAEMLRQVEDLEKHHEPK